MLTGLYLCLEPTVLSIFGHAPAPPADGADAAAADGAVSDIAYINWLLMVRGMGHPQRTPHRAPSLGALRRPSAVCAWRRSALV